MRELRHQHQHMHMVRAPSVLIRPDNHYAIIQITQRLASSFVGWLNPRWKWRSESKMVVRRKIVGLKKTKKKNRNVYSTAARFRQTDRIISKQLYFISSHFRPASLNHLIHKGRKYLPLMRLFITRSKSLLVEQRLSITCNNPATSHGLHNLNADFLPSLQCTSCDTHSSYFRELTALI